MRQVTRNITVKASHPHSVTYTYTIHKYFKRLYTQVVHGAMNEKLPDVGIFLVAVGIYWCKVASAAADGVVSVVIVVVSVVVAAVVVVVAVVGFPGRIVCVHHVCDNIKSRA